MSDLERIERQLIQIKWIFLSISILLLIGLFTPKALLDLVGLILLIPVVIGVAIYLFLKVLESVLKKKLELNVRESEKELFKEFLQAKEENRVPAADADGVAQP